MQADHKALQSVLALLTSEQICRVTIGGLWTTKDVIAHLAAWNLEFRDEIRRILRDSSTWPKRYESKTGENAFNQRAVEKRETIPWPDVLKEWEESYTELEKVTLNLSPEEWNHQVPGSTWEDGRPVTTHSLFSYEYEGAGHEGGHAIKIRKYFNLP